MALRKYKLEFDPLPKLEPGVPKEKPPEEEPPRKRTLTLHQLEGWARFNLPKADL